MEDSISSRHLVIECLWVHKLQEQEILHQKQESLINSNQRISIIKLKVQHMAVGQKGNQI